jgi:peptide deformylase
MIKPIYTYGEEILTKKAEDIDLNDPLLSQLIIDMFDTMRAANGVGLAAPQIGVSKKVIVVEIEENFKHVFINPKILAVGGDSFLMEEACLSIPNISEKINRPFMIALQWYDEDKKLNKQVFVDIPSRIIQHELDHLDGKLYIDHLYLKDNMKLFGKLSDIKNKKINVNYLIK